MRTGVVAPDVVVVSLDVVALLFALVARTLGVAPRVCVCWQVERARTDTRNALARHLGQPDPSCPPQEILFLRGVPALSIPRHPILQTIPAHIPPARLLVCLCWILLLPLRLRLVSNTTTV